METVPPLIKVFGKLSVKEIGDIFKKHCTKHCEHCNADATTLTDFLAMKHDIVQAQIHRNKERQEKKDEEKRTGTSKEQEEGYKFQRYYTELSSATMLRFSNITNKNNLTFVLLSILN